MASSSLTFPSLTLPRHFEHDIDTHSGNMTNKGDAKVSAYKQASLRHRQEFHDHLDLTLRLQADLKSDADQLKAQEGWDVATCKGIDVWTDDLATVFRFLKVKFLFIPLNSKLTVEERLES